MKYTLITLAALSSAAFGQTVFQLERNAQGGTDLVGHAFDGTAIGAETSRAGFSAGNLTNLGLAYNNGTVLYTSPDGAGGTNLNIASYDGTSFTNASVIPFSAADLSNRSIAWDGSNIFTFELNAQGGTDLVGRAFDGTTIGAETSRALFSAGNLTNWSFAYDNGTLLYTSPDGAGGTNLNTASYDGTSFTNTITTPLSTADIVGNGLAFDGRVTNVPEPSSAALLGLGGLALILRRRK